MEVVDHDLGLLADGVIMRLDVKSQLLLGPLDVELRVFLDFLDEHDRVDSVLGRLVFVLLGAGQGNVHRGRRPAALAGMGLVDQAG
jgi:hypothetical protein